MRPSAVMSNLAYLLDESPSLDLALKISRGIIISADRVFGKCGAVLLHRNYSTDYG